MNVFNWKLGLFNPGGRSEIRGHHHVHLVSRNLYMCLNYMWGAGIGPPESGNVPPAAGLFFSFPAKRPRFWCNQLMEWVQGSIYLQSAHFGWILGTAEPSPATGVTAAAKLPFSHPGFGDGEVQTLHFRTLQIRPSFKFRFLTLQTLKFRNF